MDDQNILGTADDIKTINVPHFFVVARMKNSSMGWFALGNCGIDHRDRTYVANNAELLWGADHDLKIIKVLLPVL